MKGKPRSNAQSDADRRAYDAIFNRNMYVTRLAYRIPFFVIEVLVILVSTFAAPICAGWLLVAAITVVQKVYPTFLQLIGYWFLGIATIGGAGITIFIILAIWSAVKDAAVRLWKLIRERKQA